MNPDTLMGGGLFLAAMVYLIQRNLTHTVVWLASRVTTETFENEKEKDEKKNPENPNPSPAPPKTSDPHLDIGTTILHAYRNLTPEQIGGMRRDTKELMALQKELMGSLSEMKPAIEQGAELLKTFGTFFGKGDGQPSE